MDVLARRPYLYTKTTQPTSFPGGFGTVRGGTVVTDRCTDTFLSKLVVVGSYPFVIALGFALYMAFTLGGMPIAAASFAALLVGAALITLHEIMLPYRAEWHPPASEVNADLLFMVVVQVALPYFLAITLVTTLSRFLTTGEFTVHRLWPHHFPIAAQACLMLLAADFPRYWLHRAFHKYTSMWQFHAVHHSPHRLYWLNVGRFHPIEKAVQYVVDTLPFALMGVAEDVLVAYFIFYGLNGFFQHSNCRVRLGPMNFIVSGPELHRWHHSELVEESDTNFGNNLIIWDLLFGTRFLPQEREVGPLGLINRNYPIGFFVQMKTPFIRGLEKG